MQQMPLLNVNHTVDTVYFQPGFSRELFDLMNSFQFQCTKNFDVEIFYSLSIIERCTRLIDGGSVRRTWFMESATSSKNGQNNL